MKNPTRKIADGKWLSLLLILLAVAMATTTIACGKRGGAESAGEKIDEAVEDAKDAVDKDGPIEDAGEKIDEKLDKD